MSVAVMTSPAARRELPFDGAGLNVLIDPIYHSPGFVHVVLGNAPGDPRENFLALAKCLGQALPQDERGTILLDIVESSPSDAMETSFHTDGAFAPIAPDVFGLLCLRPAADGGTVQVVNARAVLRDLIRRCPEAMEALTQPVPFDASRQIVADEHALTEVPIVAKSAHGDLLMRYFRPQIDRDALGVFQRRAIAHFEDAIFAAPRVEVSLAAGDCVFVNNRWLLHNRTRFKRAASSAERRRMLRVWLRQSPSTQQEDYPWPTNLQRS
ncbi:MAG: TauD/TfdA family dioxygenase [Acidobacteriota bacterium]